MSKIKRTRIGANAEAVQQADKSVIVIDPAKCFFPPACPGCSNCDRPVRMVMP